MVLGRLRHGAALAAVMAALALARRPRPLSERDPILLAGFENKTGEPVFDATLAHALAVQLGQSPFLNIVADDRVRDTLPLMGRDANERLTPELAREVCQRLATRAMVRGSISRAGCALRAAARGDRVRDRGLAREGAGRDAARRAGAPHARRDGLAPADAGGGVAQVGAGVRRARWPRPRRPRSRRSGPTRWAWRSGGAARRSRRSRSWSARSSSIPSFAAAATTLSTVYGNLGEASKSVQYARRAYDNRARVSERERLFIMYQYHDRVTGDMQAAADTLDVWKQTYRSDFEPANALALLHNRLGRYDRGAEEAREALARTPGHPFALSNLAYAYRALGRATEARQVAEQAVALGVATVPTRRLLYHAALLVGDTAAAQAQLDWAAGKPREFDLVAAQAQVAAYEGRLRRASELYQATLELAERHGLPEAGRSYVAHDALAHALYGSRATALTRARAALSPRREGDAADALPRLRAMTVLGLLGAPEAAALARELAERRPQSTLALGVLLPTTRAAIELSRGRAAQAVEELRAAAAYETGTDRGADPDLSARRACCARETRVSRSRSSSGSWSTAASTRSRPCARWRGSASRARSPPAAKRSSRRRPIAPSSTCGRTPTRTCRCCKRRAPRPLGSPARSAEAMLS